MVVTTVALWLVLLCLPSAADAARAPHVAESKTTDSCAMCHRSHSAASDDVFAGLDGIDRSSLTLGSGSASAGDTQLCFSCHGYESLGSSVDIQTDSQKRSVHRLASRESSYGPSPKDCSHCHDSHGAARTASDTPYPALLRAKEGTGAVYAGDAYCDTCHKNRAGDLWSGISVWKQTAHADITATASGTQIVCSACHAPHGSDNRALVVEQLTPPSAPATASVSANDRTLCFGCHPNGLATYEGTAVYQGSGHGSSVTTVPVGAEWASRLPEASREASRVVGECQVCHSSMGRDDGTGKPVPKLLKAEGPRSCYQCHGAGSTRAVDIESEYQTAAAPVAEVIASYAGAASEFGVTQVYARDTSTPGALASPRQPLGPGGGVTAAGDIDGDGRDEALVSRGSVDMSVVERDSLAGLKSQDATLMAAPLFVAVGDVLDNATGPQNEIITADASVVRVYRWDDPGFRYLAAVPASGTITGIAVGDVAGVSGVDKADVVVTTTGAALEDNRMLVLSANGADIDTVGDYALGGLSPKGPSVGEFDGAGKRDVAIAFAEETTDPLRIFSGEGALLDQGGATSANEPAQYTIFANVLFDDTTPGAEICVSYADPNGSARVEVFGHNGGSLAAPLVEPLAASSNPSSMDAGDIDGDGHVEVVVALAGSYENRVAAGVHLVQADAAGTALGTGFVADYYAGGIERSGDAAGDSWVAVADLGDLGVSGHAVNAVSGKHASTETASFDRHVDCADCHNVHASTDTSAEAPVAYGKIVGTWGVGADQTQKRGITNEYELCFKCHSAWNRGETRNIAAEVNSSRASVHAIEGTATGSDVPAETFEGSWTTDSVLYCTSCHGNSAPAGVPGLHVSGESPLLKAAYVGAPADSPSALCYTCHRYDVYYTGSAEATLTTGSRFWDTTGAGSLHALHGATAGGLSCQACHSSHGSTEQHLVRDDIGYSHATPGGSCDNSCHTSGETYSGR